MIFSGFCSVLFSRVNTSYVTCALCIRCYDQKKNLFENHLFNKYKICSLIMKQQTNGYGIWFFFSSVFFCLDESKSIPECFKMKQEYFYRHHKSEPPNFRACKCTKQSQTQRTTNANDNRCLFLSISDCSSHAIATKYMGYYFYFHLK